MNDMEEIRLRGELARTREERDRLRESEAELHRIRQGLILDNDRLREALEDIAERNLPEITAIARNALKETT